MLHVVIDLGRAQQRLGRDAAPVQADAAEIGFFHDRGLETKLRRTDRGDIAAGPGADDDDVEGCIGHVLLALCFLPLSPCGSWDKKSSADPPHTIIITGFSISILNAPISSAPSAPSTAR